MDENETVIVDDYDYLVNICNFLASVNADIKTFEQNFINKKIGL